jgi:protein JSN1
MPNGQTVRIGFGKADSAPVAPAKGNPVSPSPTSPSSGTSKSSTNNAAFNAMDAQLQSTPTRALWIGSIPSSTTPATILSVFSPYGPIESARVLTHKNCGFSKFYLHVSNAANSLMLVLVQSTLSAWMMRSELAKPLMVVTF